MPLQLRLRGLIFLIGRYLPTPPPPQHEIEIVAESYLRLESKRAVEAELGMTEAHVRTRLQHASEQGLLGTKPVLPSFRLSQTTAVTDGEGNVVREFIQQKPERGGVFEVPDGQKIKGVSALVDGDKRIINQWIKTDADRAAQQAAMEAAVEALKEEIPRAEPIMRPASSISSLLCQYTITDNHLGALAWNEETQGGDYDLTIGERLIMDWFAAAIEQAPDARRGVLAQLGDFLHYDSFKSITPEHGNLLDGDTRYPKMVRAAIRIFRRVIAMLLEKHEQIDLIMADANHDPSSEVWLREMFAAWLADEPRVHVITNPGSYSYIEHGLVSLFFHHGHRRKISDVDSVFAGKYREVYGRTRFSYAHIGHLHKDELKSTNLMKVEQHETLAAPDAYAANGGWLSGRSAKVITYHDQFGEVGRNILTPEMVAGAYIAANDNRKSEVAA